MPPSDRGRGPTRATPVLLLALAGALLAARIGFGVWQAVSPDARPDLVAWTTPEQAASEPASARLRLYAFTDRSQPSSRALVREVFANPNAAARIGRSFVPVRIDGAPAGDSPAAHALRERFGVTQLPTLVVANADGSRFKAVVGWRDARTTSSELAAARLEVMGLPIPHRGGFQFRVGGRDSLGGGSLFEPEDAGSDSVAK